MNLYPTWDGLTGPNIHYVVEYRVTGTLSWIIAATNIHVNYFDILNVPDNFYDIRISHVCANTTVNITYLSIGKSPCTNPIFVNYQVIDDTDVYQQITINFIDAGPNIKVKITRLNDNVILLEESVTTDGTYTFTLPKSATKVFTYQVDLANVCTEQDSSFVWMGDYSVQKVSQGLTLTYINNCTCPSVASFTYNRQDILGTYIDPVAIPRGIYDIYVSIPGNSCTKQLTLTVSVLQGITEVLTDSIIANQSNSFYVFPFSSINMKNGTYTGQYATETKFTLTCS